MLLMQTAKSRSRVNDKDEPNHNAKRARHNLAQCTKVNLQKDSEAEIKGDEPKGLHPSEQPQEFTPLSEEDLQSLYKEVMDSAAKNTLALKRTSLRRSIALSEADTVQTQRSSNTTAYYRYKHLAAADVYIHTDPPKDIQAAIDRIVKAKVSKDHRAKLRDIAKELYKACKETVQAAAGEDDFIDLFYTALKAMAPDNIFFRAKADWREELKPITKRSDLNLSFLVNFKAADSYQQQEVNGVSAPPPPPPKRQQQSAGQTYISPLSSMTVALDSTPDNRPLQSDTTPPPASRPHPEKVKETSFVKTPRPDISVGTQETALISALSALSSQHLNNTRAKRFLEKLEDTMVPSERGGPAEPLLVAVPTQRASDLVFPFAVVEGKAYSTGKQIFEAQNQAAVSGASGLKIQLSLNELIKRSTSDVAPSTLKDQPPLFFSICTEGPYHELWAHYTDMEDDVRKFNMKLLKICNGVLLEGVEDFIATVDNVLRWGTGRFLESVVERLVKVARKAGA